jgi:hypothetical protein
VATTAIEVTFTAVRRLLKHRTCGPAAQWRQNPLGERGPSIPTESGATVEQRDRRNSSFQAAEASEDSRHRLHCGDTQPSDFVVRYPPVLLIVAAALLFIDILAVWP